MTGWSGARVGHGRVATTDELTAPLGIGRDRGTSPARRLGPAGFAALLAVPTAILGLCVTMFGDPLGGRPYLRVEIARPQAAVGGADTPHSAAIPDEPGASARQSADLVESASGVSVVRPHGTAAPESVIVRIPDGDGIRLRPAPDPRLVEPSRYGALPRIGPDGARPLDVYARPAGELPGGARPAGRVAVVVGGLGISRSATGDAVARLPAPVTLAFAPYGAELDKMAAAARADGHEIMLQVPMEPFDYPDSDPGPHTLTTSARASENLDHLQWVMSRITGYVGLLNYMGGKFTADERALAPVVKEAASRGLALVDDGSSSRSLLSRTAADAPAGRASVVIDAAPRPEQIDKALARLEAAALAEGVAIGSASALPVSLDRIARWAAGLEARGILLVPVSAALRSPARASASR